MTHPLDRGSATDPPPATPSDGIAAVRLLFQVEHQLHMRIDRLLRPCRLSFAGYEILMCLWLPSGAPPAVGEMGDILRVHPTSISSTLDRLAECGYLVRTRDTDDARVVRPLLTAEGRRTVERATSLLRDGVFTDLGLDDSETDALLRILRSLRANAGDFWTLRRPRTA